ncbi:MAG TPA: thiolase family protein [Anaeromyxobacteraceae bacterium]|nr:thiolase family protein [Anaeromyxobacteraceae bacterium]
MSSAGRQDVYVVEALRTPFGSLGGALSTLSAPQLAAPVMRAIVERTGLDPARLDRVIVGQVLTAGAGQAPARQAMRAAGIPDSVGATTVNKVCGSGLEAVMLGASAIRGGDARLVLAGGMESMSRAPYLLDGARSGYRLGHGRLLDALVHDGLTDAADGRHMGEVADAAAARHAIGRAEQDEYALRSYRLAQRAVAEGLLDAELVPVVKASRKGEERVERDEEPFRVELERLPKLRPAFGEGGTITAGNASTINDGAAIALLAGREAVDELGLAPRARLVAQATFSMAPDRFTDAPVGAVKAVCRAAGVGLHDVEVFELNEAFALVPLIAQRQLELPLDRINPNGGAVALGHPIGASGGRLVATLVRELHRRQARYGVAALCIGGGEAVAALLERA